MEAMNENGRSFEAAIQRGPPPLRCSERISAAMFEIGSFMVGEQFDNAGPEPTWGVERLRAIAAEFAPPLPAEGCVHLPAMALPTVAAR